MRGEEEALSFNSKEHAERCVTEASGARQDRSKDRLNVRRRVRDDTQDLARRRLLLDRLRQALLKVANPGSFVLPQLPGDRELGFDLRLRGLCTPTHRPLPCFSRALTTAPRSTTG